MKNKALIVIGLFIAALVMPSCSGGGPESSLLQRYFAAVSMRDNDTMSSIALEPLALEVASWKIVSVSPEKMEPASLPELTKKEAEYKRLLEGHVGPTLDAKTVLDNATDELDLARTAAAKAAKKKEVEAAQAKYDEEFNKQKEYQKQYNDAKSAAAREEEVTRFSLGVRELATIRDLTGTVHSKDVVVSITPKNGQPKEYKLPMRMYQLTDTASGAKYPARWIIISFEPIG